jgi:inner membrane protein
MDTITHTLFGLTTYGAVKKDEMDQKTKRALLFSAVVASQIPDIDVVANLTETGRVMEQMWHRGLTHSFFLAPVWALLIYLSAYVIWRRSHLIIYYLALINVFIHNATDSLNAWGTGIFEPFSDVRITFGVVPIVDFVIWALILAGYITIRVKKQLLRHKVWRVVWLAIVLHISFQGIQGYVIHNEAKQQYNEVALSASFIPGQFTVIGKMNGTVNIYTANIWQGRRLNETLISMEEADLELLFQENPKAEVLMQWSPFVVVVESDKKLGIYDPRFYRNGESFLFEFIEYD